MAPKSGWEDVLADGRSPRRLLFGGLIPLAAIAAVTVWVGAFYQRVVQWDVLTLSMIVTFARYLLTYFIAVWFLGYSLSALMSGESPERERIELLAVYCVGMLAIIGIIENLMPMSIPLLQFLPIYIVVVINQARWFMNVDDANMFRYASCAIVGIILPVYIIDKILLP